MPTFFKPGLVHHYTDNYDPPRKARKELAPNSFCFLANLPNWMFQLFFCCVRDSVPLRRNPTLLSVVCGNTAQTQRDKMSDPSNARRKAHAIRTAAR